ncbi:hypothetical protein K6V92_21955 [Cupriavidus respiraculi]|uniref:hypothetical protein n=1 Tax=Cupriavidus respiraculi TaxID=195930 RepID=UPI001C972558|nr:hypothetical protein [Cupriavidus respiraculi]MBY4949272.1 hypothetical protein [Cupriavidus respiraculi]
MPDISPIQPPIQPTPIQPISPARYGGDTGPALQAFPRDPERNWYETARKEMHNPGASPADKPKWIKPDPPLTPGMSLADLKALAVKNNWEAMAFTRPGPPAVLTVVRFRAGGDPLVSTDGKSFAVLDEVHHLPTIWQHHADIHCRRVKEERSWDEEARRRHVGMHLDALAQQIDTLDHDLQEYRKAALEAADSCSLKAAVDACQMLRTRLEAERSALMAEQEVDLMEPRVLPRAPQAVQPPVPPAVAAPGQRLTR